MVAEIREVLLRRQGLAFVEPHGGPAPAELVDAVEAELAALGYAPTTRLRARLGELGVGELTAWSTRTRAILAEGLGTSRKLEPLFAHFPDGVPADTTALRWQRLLIHYLQLEGQPCLWCKRIGTTHVLKPCTHVVCDHCFDGSNYRACPICQRHVDRDSPFFRTAPVPVPAARLIRFKLVDLGDDLDGAARALFESLCARKQAMSPTDAGDLSALVKAYGPRVLPWLPATIAVRENQAIVFGTLFRDGDPAAILPIAQPRLRTATDVLRLIAAASGGDVSLQATLRLVVEDGRARWVTQRRFTVMKLPRPLRRALLAILEGLDPDLLVEDFLRHASLWKWVGQLLHPHEYARRFPRVARAFAVVRGRAPDGTPAPRFRSFAARVQDAAAAGDARAMVATLAARPGELGRRLDHALRVAGSDAGAVGAVTDAFVAAAPRMSTPVLLTLRTLLPTRRAPLPVRMFWPKGPQAIGASIPDTRPPLPADAIAAARRAADAELLRRFAARGPVGDAIVDAALADLMVPFNERTASRGAIALARGTRLPVPASKAVRLFLHWCQPQGRSPATDVDLSVAFYDQRWAYLGVCAYYELQWSDADGQRIAASAGDLTDAPWPDGATELVDVDRRRALAAGARYAVMVVNAYSGLTFSALARGFAGLMLRDEVTGVHVDPRDVELKFDLAGDHGMFAPLALDLATDTLHWLDVYAQGQLAFNNVATSNRAITTIVPNLIAYFGSGVRASMRELALLHAAARAERVWIRDRDGGARTLARRPGEDAAGFLARLEREPGTAAPLAGAFAHGPVLAALVHGDLELPAGSTAYALFRERITAPIAAADLLS